MLSSEEKPLSTQRSALKLIFMNCADVQEYLYEYHTGRLDEQTRRDVEAHLAACPACRQALEELKIDLKLLDHARPPELSADFKDRVMRGIEGAKVIPLRRGRAYKYVLQGTVAAAVVLAAAVTFIMKSPRSGEQAVRGERAASVTAACAKAVELYNKGTTAPDPRAKEGFFQEALSLGCGDRKVLARIKNNLADCFEQQGKEQEAVDLYKEAIGDDPELVYPYVSLGDYYVQRGDTLAAVRFYEKALELLEATPQPDRQEIERVKTELERLRRGEKP